jgi:hypothetical protein
LSRPWPEMRPSYMLSIGQQGHRLKCIPLRPNAHEQGQCWEAMVELGVVRAFRSALAEHMPEQAAKLNPGGSGTRVGGQRQPTYWHGQAMACALAECGVSARRAAGLQDSKTVRQ